jgi:hypothetical protein
MRTFVTLIALLAAFAGVAEAAGPKLTAPRTARVGDSVTARATHLKTGGRYALTLVADDRPARNASCVRKIAKPAAAPAGKVTLTGTIPRKLTCWQNNRVRLGRVTVADGAYHLIVAVPDGPAGFSVKYSFVRSALKIKR